MRYMGGKTRIAKQIAAVIDQYREPGQLVWDAFCGGLSVSVALSEKGPVLSSDANQSLIALYKAVQNGWVPPTKVSREDYELAKTLPNNDPLKALIGFGSSFGGKWFAGYAGGLNGKLTYAQLAARNVQKSVKACHRFECMDFLLEQVSDNYNLIYCDPPYVGTTGYSAVGKFNHDIFYEKCQQWSKHATLFVSEYTLPFGECVWKRSAKGTLGIDHGVPATEKLFYIAKGSL